MTADAAVIWSVLWHGRMQANQAVYQHYHSNRRPVICIDVGALDRGRTWKIAVNNITALGYYGHQSDLDCNRPAKLGIKLGSVKKPRDAVLFVAQHPKSLQVEHCDQTQWILQQIQNLRRVVDWPMFVRPHPRGKINLEPLRQCAIVQSTKLIPGTYDNFDLDFAYRAVVNYNSGAGVQAALAGANIVVDNTSLAAPVSMCVSDVNDPPQVDRQQWLIEICHTEYTVQEIEQGLWLKRLSCMLQRT